MPHKRAKRSVREQNRSANGADLAPAKNALSDEAIPKSVARVLNAARVQEEWKKRKGAEDDGSGGKPRKRQKTDEDKRSGQAKGKAVKHNLKILPGESLTHFNRRVEDSMRPLLRDAIQTSAAVARKVKKDEELEREAKKKGKAQAPADVASSKSTKGKSKADDSEESEDEDEDAKLAKPTKAQPIIKEKPKEFATFSASAPRRLNDIAEAPPELKKLPRGAKPRKASEVGVKSLRDGVLSMAQKAMLEEERERVIKAYREMKKRGPAA
ncbi:hypothetical protein PHLGIDRAFT_517102 [Phlebiopsis gigantea 11061_1 CR5-6]|uniref:Uncharacterized protein n=1 Tax=Phlebiopsis gigantea (strain 11061_1 CR5-6) TaxID=745531 RepID=A0A0C3S966_PHLG1|nr:hypothetical protein PHLGIDRAFT_517102 [Phlebiopsis gigantea 11061_1 CR5-6]